MMIIIERRDFCLSRLNNSRREKDKPMVISTKSADMAGMTPSLIPFCAKKKPELADIYILVNDCAVIVAGSVRSESLKKLARKVVSEVPGVNVFIEDLTWLQDSTPLPVCLPDWM